MSAEAWLTPRDGIPAPLRIPSRRAIATAIETMIALLDAMDGDPDRELNGDETDGQPSEDDWRMHEPDGPGCPLADAGGTDNAEEEK